MQNLPVSIFPSATDSASLYAASSVMTAEEEAFADILEEKRSIYEDDPNRTVEETSTTLLNRMGNTLFTGGTRLLNKNINATNGLFSETTIPRDSSTEAQKRLSSFIDPERMTYGGLPSDFDALIVQNGTFSRDDMNLLKKILKEKGAHEASLDALNQLMASGSPLTLATAINKLLGQTRLHEELSDDERSVFRLLGNKAGINILEADHLLALSDAGNVKELWNRFVGKLSAMDSPTLDLTKKEAEALLKGLDMSQATRKAVLGQFAQGQDSITLTKDELNKFLSAVRNELTERDNAQRHCATILDAAVKDTLEQRRLSDKTSLQSDMRNDSSSERLETRIQDSILQKSGMTDLADEQDNLSREFAEHGNEKNLKDTSRGATPTREHNEFRVDNQIGTLSATSNVTEKTAPPAGLHTITLQSDTGSSLAQGNAKNIHQLAQQHRQEIFQQVQSGFLRNHPNGTTQLTLQLDPKDLGQLSLIMTSREGELRGIIRAENAETAAVLSEQLEHLRATLEEQGLKIAELEVKTGLQNDTNQHNWQGPQEHNQRYEAEHRARIRRLAQIRMGSPAQETVTVKATNVAHDGLHVVA